MVGACTLVPRAGLAQSEETARRAARQLGNEGIELYEAEDYAAAQERLERAYRVMQVSTLGLWLARARAKNGKLVEASELYLEVSRMRPEPDAPEVIREAIQTARTEYEALDARIPSLTITLPPDEDTSGIQIAMDGDPLRSALIGVPIAVNPGRHRFEVRRQGKVLAGDVELAEGERKAVALTFKDSGNSAAPPPPTPPTPAEAPAPGKAEQGASTPPPGSVAASPTPTTVDRGTSGNGHKVLAFSLLGVGAAGLIGGGALGAAAVHKKNELDDGPYCNDTACSPYVASDVKAYNGLRVGTTVSLAVGGTAAVTGVILLLAGPKRPRSGAVGAWIAPTSAGVRGTF